MTAPSWDRIRDEAARVGLHVVTRSDGTVALWRGSVQVFHCGGEDDAMRSLLAAAIDYAPHAEMDAAARERGLTALELAQLVALADEMKEE